MRAKVKEKTPKRRAGTRGSGRPRSAKVDAAILRAAFALFVEHGIEGASIEKIARRAKVAKTSIYRRWPSREALLAQAIETGRDTGGYTAERVDHTAPRDLVKLLLGASALMARPQLRKLAARMIGSLPDSPRLMAVYRDTYYRPRRQAFIHALERAQEAGLLPKTAAVEVLADMLAGALTYRMLVAPAGEDSAGHFRAYMIALLRAVGFDVSGL